LPSPHNNLVDGCILVLLLVWQAVGVVREMMKVMMRNMTSPWVVVVVEVQKTSGGVAPRYRRPRRRPCPAHTACYLWFLVAVVVVLVLADGFRFPNNNMFSLVYRSSTIIRIRCHNPQCRRPRRRHRLLPHILSHNTCYIPEVQALACTMEIPLRFHFPRHQHQLVV
jgi:hypothetical protein